MSLGLFANSANAHHIANEMAPRMAMTPEIAKTTVTMLCDDNKFAKAARQGTMLNDENCTLMQKGET